MGKEKNVKLTKIGSLMLEKWDKLFIYKNKHRKRQKKWNKRLLYAKNIYEKCYVFKKKKYMS